MSGLSPLLATDGIARLGAWPPANMPRGSLPHGALAAEFLKSAAALAIGRPGPHLLVEDGRAQLDAHPMRMRIRELGRGAFAPDTSVLVRTELMKAV